MIGVFEGLILVLFVIICGVMLLIVVRWRLLIGCSVLSFIFLIFDNCWERCVVFGLIFMSDGEVDVYERDVSDG